MSLVIIGFNHKSTSIALREKLACSTEEQLQLMTLLCQKELVKGIMVLSTCNRLEFICNSDNFEDILDFYANMINIDLKVLAVSAYYYHEEQAFEHMVRVATGLDSMLIGETQILGQFKSSFNFASKHGFLDSMLVNILPRIFQVAKHVRSKNILNENPTCYASAIIKLAKSVFNLDGKNVLFIGSGDFINNISWEFVKQPFNKIYIASRTFENAEKIAKKVNIQPINMKDITTKLADVDIIVSAVSSQIPILGKGMVETALKGKLETPMLFIDLGVPRNIEPEVQTLAGAYLYNIDNLQDILENEALFKEEAKTNIANLIKTEANISYNNFKLSRAVSIVRDFRLEVEAIRGDTLRKSLTALDSGQDPAEVLQIALRQLTQKILHKPTLNIRKAVAARREDILKLTKDFFELSGK